MTFHHFNSKSIHKNVKPSDEHKRSQKRLGAAFDCSTAVLFHRLLGLTQYTVSRQESAIGTFPSWRPWQRRLQMPAERDAARDGRPRPRQSCNESPAFEHRLTWRVRTPAPQTHLHQRTMQSQGGKTHRAGGKKATRRPQPRVRLTLRMQGGAAFPGSVAISALGRDVVPDPSTSGREAFFRSRASALLQSMEAGCPLKVCCCHNNKGNKGSPALGSSCWGHLGSVTPDL